MTCEFLIKPGVIYDDATLCEALDITRASLTRARNKGELRFTHRGGRTFYLGEWVLHWLLGDGKEISPAAPTPQRFAELMRDIETGNDDLEERHRYADAQLCETLELLGYGAGVKVYREMGKWHA